MIKLFVKPVRSFRSYSYYSIYIYYNTYNIMNPLGEKILQMELYFYFLK